MNHHEKAAIAGAQARGEADEARNVRIEETGKKVFVNGVGFQAWPWRPFRTSMAGFLVLRAIGDYEDGKTLERIAKERGCTKNTIARLMDAAGLKRKRGGVHGSGKKEAQEAR